MLRILLFGLLFSMTSLSLHAQLPDGAIGPDFTLTDMNGVSHTLYDVLDAGKPAIIDFSATWCGPCWNYHQTHTLSDLQTQYGPNGTDQIMVYFIEADIGTNDACVKGDVAGCNKSTYGDWRIGSTFPIFNPTTNSVSSSYSVGYYPTLYGIAPNKKTYEVGQASKSNWESWLFETFALAATPYSTDATCGEDGTVGVNYTGGFGAVSFLWSNGATTQELTNVSGGTYSVVITEGRGHSIEINDIVVGGPTEVLAATGTVTDVLCHAGTDGQVALDVSGGDYNYTYAWSNGSTESTLTAAAGQYTVVITDGNACTLEQSFTIEQPEVLELDHTVLNASCEGANGIVNATAFGGAGSYSYSLNGETNTNGLFANLSAGVYDLSVTDGNECFLELPVVVIDEPLPEAVAAVDGEITCAITSLTLSGTGSSVGSQYSYQWTTTDGEITGGATTLTPTVSKAGTYTLEVTDNNFDCAVTTSVVVVNNEELPNVTINTPSEIDCDNPTVSISAAGSSTGSDFSYQWSTSNGNIVSGETTLTVEVNAVGDYTLEITNSANGCVASSSVSVSGSSDAVNANAGTAGDLTCTVTQVTLDGSGSTSGPTITYLWTTTDGNIVSGATTVNPIVDKAGTYKLEVTNTANNCVAISSTLVELDENVATPELGSPDNLTCTVTEVNLNIALPTGYSYAWTTTDGNIVSGANTTSPTVDKVGTYSCTFTNEANGCAGTASVVVNEVINTPSAAFSFTQADSDFTFTNSSAGDGNSYLWDFGDGNTSTDKDPTHKYDEDGNFEVCLTTTNECGSEKTCQEVSISSGTSLAYTIEFSEKICHEACTGTFSMNTQAQDQANLTLEIEGPNDFESKNVYSLNELCPGEYEFELTNEKGNSVDGKFEILASTAFEIGSEVTELACYGDSNASIVLNITGGEANLTTQWNTGDSTSTIENLGKGDYSVVVSDGYCTAEKSFTIEEPTDIKMSQVIIVDISDDQDEGSIDITVEGGTEPYTFLWGNGNTDEDPDDLDVGEHTVIVTDANGCTKTFGPFEVKSSVSVVEFQGLNSFNVYPNPISNMAEVKLELEQAGQVEIQVSNAIGQSLFKQDRSGTLIIERIDFSNMASGLYFISVRQGNSVSIKKIIKE